MPPTGDNNRYRHKPVSNISFLTQPVPVQYSRPVPNMIFSKSEEAVGKSATSSHRLIVKDCPHLDYMIKVTKRTKTAPDWNRDS